MRTQLTSLGSSQQQVENLNGIQGLFDVSGATGIPAAFTSLYSSFSDLSVNPSSATSRAAVIVAADNVAAAFKSASTTLGQSSSDADRQIQSQVGQINALTAEIQGYNKDQQQGGGSDPGRDANLETALEKLSSLVNISTRPSANGGTDVLLDGQIPLVLGSQQFSISAASAAAPSGAPANPNGTPPTEILDSNGADITTHVTGGSVAGLLRFRNTTLAELRGDRNQNGYLNTLAKSFADRVNSVLTSGQISQGPPAQAGVPLFSYDGTDATKVAATLSLASGFTAAQIATISPGPPVVSNGTALTLANIAQGTSTADQISGFSFTQAFGELAGRVGKLLSDQQSSADVSQQASTQAQSLRSQLSGVSLDAEAVRLTEFQKAYGASAKLISVLDAITQTTLDILK